MKFINQHGLPDAFARAVMNDPYDKGASDFSATGLQKPPRAVVLESLYRDEIEVDVSKRVATTIGQGAHSILERAYRPGVDIIEQRYYGEFTVSGEKFVVSAQIDLFEMDTGTLSDWKTTKAYAFHQKTGTKEDWISQLNIGGLLLKRSGGDVKALRIIGLLKDWDKRKAQTERGYPPFEVMSLDIPIWPEDKTVAFIEDRIKAIMQARINLPRCSAKETWGGRRCQDWCDVASHCTQYQEARRTGIIAPEGE